MIISNVYGGNLEFASIFSRAPRPEHRIARPQRLDASDFAKTALSRALFEKPRSTKRPTIILPKPNQG